MQLLGPSAADEAIDRATTLERVIVSPAFLAQASIVRSPAGAAIMISAGLFCHRLS